MTTSTGRIPPHAYQNLHPARIQADAGAQSTSVRAHRLRRRPNADEVVFEALEVRLGHHVRDDEAREVTLPPDPRREAVLVQKGGPPPVDLDALAVGDRQTRC